ncbi:MAG: DNRLRE domain-containing protein [Thermoproteota archaeon]
MRKLFILCLLLFIIGFSGYVLLYSSPGPGLCTASLQPTADAYVAENNPTVNYGSETSLTVSPGLKTVCRSLVKFDLTQMPPGSKLVSASLKLYVTSTMASGRTYECYLLNGDWAERSVTWNSQPGAVSGFTVDSTVPAAGSWISWNVVSSVSQILAGIRSNFGWGLKDKIEGVRETLAAPAPRTVFPSRESQTNKPTLEISFYPPKLTISGPASAYVETWVKLTVERRDADNQPINRGDLRVQLSSSSPSGKFALSEGGSQIIELTIPNGASKKDFYYYDTRVGSATITADTNQYRADYYEEGRFSITLETKDVEGPKVTIKAIPEKVREDGKVTVVVDASDPSGMERVKVLQRAVTLDGRLLEQSLFMETYVGYFPTSFHKEAESGSFPGMRMVEFEAEATDKYGNIGKSSTSVIIIHPPPKRNCGCRVSYSLKSDGVKVWGTWDSIATGDVVVDGRDEVIVVQDDDDGRLFVYTWNSEKSVLEPLKFSGQVFTKVKFTAYDRMAVGNVMGDEKDEILIAIDEAGEAGMIYIYQLKPAADGYEPTLISYIDLETFGCKLTHFDALLVGNVFNDDEQDEIILVRDDDGRLFVFDPTPTGSFIMHTFTVPVDLDEFRYTHHTDNEEDDDNGHDEIAVANIFGDSAEEIVYAANHENMLYVFSFKQSGGTWMVEVLYKLPVEFTKYDAMSVGDVLGDSRPEILFFRDEDRLVLIYDVLLGPIKLQYIFYSKYDGVATGDIVGLGKKQILVATDDENDIRLAYSDELREG